MLESDQNVNLDKPQKTKVGIITILGVNNYGADLQAFALYKKLDDLGFDSEIINYPFYKNSRYISEKKAKSKFSSSRITLVKDFILGILDKLGKMLNPSIAKVRSGRFEQFKTRNIRFSKEYRSFSSLYSSTHDYDVAVVGSDQVWNPNNPINLEPYFLTFIPKGVKKISYASSFGVDSIDASQLDEYKKLLRNLNTISVREKSGVKIIQSITSEGVEHVVDPTLLLTADEWDAFSSNVSVDEKYILLFVFKDTKYVDEVVKSIVKKTGMKVVRICKNEFKVDYQANYVNLRDLGPGEFLSVYKKASFVITSSFHGTIFSVIYNKPFITILPKSKNNNTRQLDFLESIGMENRALFDDTNFEFEKSILVEDFLKVNEKIRKMREKSLKYLYDSVKRSN